MSKYLQLLSERLLNRLTSGGASKENLLAIKFKTECGSDFIGQTDQMISDIMGIQPLTEALAKSTKKLKPNQTFEFTILDSTKWPIKYDVETKI